MKLYIVRHGEAAAARTDGERPLTPKGVLQAREAGKLLFAQDPQLILFSPKLRTRETASQIVAMCHGAESAVENALLPPATVYDVAGALEIAEQRGMQRIVMVSHLPLVEELVSWLVDGDFREYSLPGFPPAGIVALDTEFVGPDTSRLEWYAFPPEFSRTTH